MLRQLMIYYIKVYSLPRSQAMRFDLKHQSHCLSCIFSQKIQFAFVDCSSICKQCLCIYKGSNTHGIANLPCVFCLLGCNPNPCEHHGTVMAAHSCGVLKEHFAKMRSLHRHEAEQRVWAAPNKLLQGKGLCIYKDIACKRASAYQNGATKHCLQKLLHPSELSIPLAAVILDSSKIFQEAVAVTAKQVQIGDRSCRIYSADCAEYLLLQMTDEHELQRGYSGGKLERCTFPVGSPCCVGNARVWRQCYGHPALSDRTGHPHAEAAVSSPGKRQNHSGRLFTGRAVCVVGIHPD